jgi:uncharacterized membrane protein YfcA
MSIIQIVILLVAGIGLGFLSGLLGIGGAIIMTPVQYWLYTSAGMSTDLAIKMSFATTLAVVLPTAASGAWQHHKQGGINWKAATFMGIFTSIAGFLGASIAAHLPGSALKIAFGAVALAVGIRMVTVRISDVERPIRENRWLYIGLAVPIGLITGILGIGGGIFIVPILVLLLGYRMRYAVGTSLGIMLFTSAGAIIGYIVNGLNAPVDMPAHTIGYIYWPAWIILTASSIGLAQLGAIVAHKVHGRILNYIFVTLQFYVALNMLGVFTWLFNLFK